MNATDRTIMHRNMDGSPAGPATGVHRLFLALLPDEGVRAALARAAAEARIGRDAGLRPVDARRYHATLHFLGEHAAQLRGGTLGALLAFGHVVSQGKDWR